MAQFEFEKQTSSGMMAISVPFVDESIDKTIKTELESLTHTLQDPCLKKQALVEINRDLLNAFYIFKPESPLKTFIHKHVKPREFYTLAEVLTLLKNIIRDNTLFDVKNSSMILCSEEMEVVFNMKAFHVTEVRNLVCLHLLRLPQRYQDMLHFQNPLSVVEPFHCDKEGATATTLAARPSEHDLFELKPDFHHVLSQLPHFNRNKYRFSYCEITKFLSDYILSRKDSLLDSRNIKVALVANDPLGKAFQVNSFHRCQLASLLKKQLVPVN